MDQEEIGVTEEHWGFSLSRLMNDQKKVNTVKGELFRSQCLLGLRCYLTH